MRDILPAPTNTPDLRTIKWVILDAMGVIYHNGDDVGELLIPFLRSEGCKMPVSEIERLYLMYSLGESETENFWAACGLKGDEDFFNSKYLTMHTVNPGAISFIRRMRSLGLNVCCLSNDLSRWSRILRRRHCLEELVTPWIISGEVGFRKPAIEIYTLALSRLAAVSSECLFIDDRLKNLDVAASLGIQTVFFGCDRASEIRGHKWQVSSFGDTLGWNLT
jgi:HAD superfamily hydrolase (TIGR01509 family)